MQGTKKKPSNPPPPIMTALEELVRGIPGWSSLDQLFSLHQMVLLFPELDGDVVEVGTWCGRSALALSLAAQSLGGIQVHCVDLYPRRKDWFENEDGTFSFRVELDAGPVEAYCGQRVWREPFERDIEPLYQVHPDLMEVVGRNLDQRNLGGVARPFRGTAEMFARSRPSGFKCRLLFLDGDHGYREVSRDIKALVPFLVPGGWICFDDAHTTYEGVDRAIREHIIESGNFDLCHQPTRKCFMARLRRG